MMTDLKAAFSVAETLALEAALAGKSHMPQTLVLGRFGIGRLRLAICRRFIGRAKTTSDFGAAVVLTGARSGCLMNRMTALDAHGRELVEDLAAAHLARGGMIVAASHEALSFANA